MPERAPNAATDNRLFAEVRIALAATLGSPTRLAEEVERGRAAGLTGAEINANLAGRSFDARVQGAIGFALACRDDDHPDMLLEEISLARRAGLKDAVLAAIRDRSKEFTSTSSTSRPKVEDRD